MTLNAKRLRAHSKLAAMPGVRSIRRPVTPGSAAQFDLYYVRSGEPSAHPLLIIPGGPGMASVQLYKGLRRRAADRGLDVIMVEHRGIGLSRHDDDGADLPPEAITVRQVVEDIAAVLDDAAVEKAVVYGTSYGSYLAAGLGVSHPDRIEAMVLDSPVLSARDIEAIRRAIRDLLLHGSEPDTAELAPKVRRLVDEGTLTSDASELISMLYGYGGAPLLNRQLDLLLQGRTLLWRVLDEANRFILRKVPYRNEVDLVGRIAFRELDFAGEPDGLPLDPSPALAQMADEMPGPTPLFESEPYDLEASMPGFSWPTAVISGSRDLTTPPALAEQIAALIPQAALVRMPTTAHSVLDTRERAALEIAKAAVDGRIPELPARGEELDALPANVELRVLVGALAAATAVEGVIPSVRRPAEPPS
ncbi:alpha/beta hydrolase [Mycolicibacterium murale]|jgi:proline iminopeptidase|uniref:Alpha/beta hydrolase n=1 Tax=Mycolicibacterium murale TaxID=182220 RepID=A0A7I9WL01_9MYCO|nr:alpha/beta hydrolase [Mycolicibacterium murale]MCV7185362.1 alpha/beta hydrolase [Mycolicibacterium murale]GFG57956.1 alpha/beta hydrolase [Mycolicibacterium murale]